jgi:hypothetical protein
MTTTFSDLAATRKNPKGVWLNKRWTYVYVQLDGTIVSPRECGCIADGINRAGGASLVFDPLQCPIDFHRTRFMQADDPEELRDRLYPYFDFDGVSDWRDTVTVADCEEPYRVEAMERAA